MLRPRFVDKQLEVYAVLYTIWNKGNEADIKYLKTDVPDGI